MPHHNCFSALDRHAVLSGSDNGFPWYAGAMLAGGPGEVVRLPAETPGHGLGRAALPTVGVKIAAAREAVASWLSAIRRDAILQR